jgi:hypothetical protein
LSDWLGVNISPPTPRLALGVYFSSLCRFGIGGRFALDLFRYRKSTEGMIGDAVLWVFRYRHKEWKSYADIDGVGGGYVLRVVSLRICESTQVG